MSDWDRAGVGQSSSRQAHQWDFSEEREEKQVSAPA